MGRTKSNDKRLAKGNHVSASEPCCAGRAQLHAMRKCNSTGSLLGRSSISHPPSGLRALSITSQAKAGGSQCRRGSKRSVPRSPRGERLHPLTCQHNIEMAKSAGTLTGGDQVRERNLGCTCNLCSSPRGSWRNDALEDEVEDRLDEVAAMKDGRPRTLESDSFTAPRQTCMNLLTPSLGRKTLTVGKTLSAGRSSLHASRGDETAAMDKELRIAHDDQSPPEREKKCLQQFTAMTSLDVALRKPVPARKTVKETQAHAQAVVMRRVAQQQEFVERARSELCAKVQRFEERQQIRVEQANQEARLALVAAEDAERSRRWASMLHATFVVRCLREVVVANRLTAMVRSGGDAVQRVVEEFGNTGVTVPLPDNGKVSDAALAERFVRSEVRRLLLLRYVEVARQRTGTIAKPEPGAMRSQSSGRRRTMKAVMNVVKMGSDANRWANAPRPLVQNSDTQEAAKKQTTEQLSFEKIRAILASGTTIISVFPWMQELAVRGGSCDWGVILHELAALLEFKKSIRRRWTCMTIATRFLGKLLKKRYLARAADRAKGFLRLLLVHNHLNLGIKHAFANVRLIQRNVRRFLHKESTKRYLIDTVLRRCEDEMLIKHWISECHAILVQERHKLKGLRVKKDRLNSERVVSVSLENIRRYKCAKTDGDQAFIAMQLRRHRMPNEVMNAAVQHACAARKLLVSREIATRARVRQKFQRELQTWIDIEQAVKLIDPSGGNPASKPELPVNRRLPFLVETSAVAKIIRRLRAWYEVSRDEQKNRASVSVEQEQSDVGTSVGEIVREVILTPTRSNCRPSTAPPLRNLS